MSKTGCILGMDIGGTNFRMGLVDRDLQVHHLRVYPSRKVYESGDTVEQFAACVKEYAGRYGEDFEILAAAVGCPSVVDQKRRKLYSSTNFPGLEGIDLVGELEARLPWKVMIDHDAYYLLAYDMEKSGIKSEGTVIGCYFGTGLGNAMYMDGKPYIGRNGTACELGHLPVPFNNYPCSCGNKGCIEMFSCGKALESIAEEQYPEISIGEVFRVHAGDEVLLRFVEYMAIAVAAEVNILDPDCVFVGGGVVQMEGFPRDYFVEKVIAHTRKPYPAENLDLRFASPGSENGIVGAAIRAFAVL
ncbi:MAG: allose kinase [Lachnospiraceae bacterium]|nr:allose kinase [Lachnospiraceae bacterium]